jgi:hypothetical protein
MKNKIYKELLGNRIYVDIDLPKYTIEISKTEKDKIIAEAAQKLNKAKVFDIGSGVHELNPIKIGDIVLVGKEGITRGDIVNLSEDKTVVCINPMDIIMIW